MINKCSFQSLKTLFNWYYHHFVGDKSEAKLRDLSVNTTSASSSRACTASPNEAVRSSLITFLVLKNLDEILHVPTIPGFFNSNKRKFTEMVIGAITLTNYSAYQSSPQSYKIRLSILIFLMGKLRFRDYTTWVKSQTDFSILETMKKKKKETMPKDFQKDLISKETNW